jgi:hypothetical protein
MKTVILLSLVSSGVAFAPSTNSAGALTSLEASKADLIKIAEKANPIIKVRLNDTKV